jgi:hypothetical protein
MNFDHQFNQKIRKLEELLYFARIFILNNINSKYPLEISAMQEFEQKWRETHSLIQGKRRRSIKSRRSPLHESKGP